MTNCPECQGRNPEAEDCPLCRGSGIKPENYPLESFEAEAPA